MRPRPAIDPAARPGAAESVEFVGGPRDGQSEKRFDLPDRIPQPAGHYQRSVRCADDGAMRYVWRDEEVLVADGS